MSNSVKTTLKVEIVRENILNLMLPLKTVTVATTSDIYSVNTQIVGTAHELVAVGDVTDDAMMIVENLHATALVQVGGDVAAAFVPWIDIPALGPPAILPVVSTIATTYLKSSVASTPIRITLVKIVP